MATGSSFGYSSFHCLCKKETEFKKGSWFLYQLSPQLALALPWAPVSSALLYRSPGAAPRTVAQMIEMCCLTVLEARSPRSRWRPGWFFLRAGRENSVPAWLLSSWMAVPSLCLLTWHSSCVPVTRPVINPLYKDTSHVGWGPP